MSRINIAKDETWGLELNLRVLQEKLVTESTLKFANCSIG
jgi:hypothetical protein